MYFCLLQYTLELNNKGSKYIIRTFIMYLTLYNEPNLKVINYPTDKFMTKYSKLEFSCCLSTFNKQISKKQN